MWQVKSREQIKDLCYIFTGFLWDQSYGYGCVAYMSAAEANLRKLDAEQAQALRICSEAFKLSPLSTTQVQNLEKLLWDFHLH